MTSNQQIGIREGLKVRFKGGGDAVWTVGLVANGHVWIAEWNNQNRSATSTIERFWDAFELVENPFEDEPSLDRLIEESLTLDSQWEAVSRPFGGSQFEEDDALAELHAVGHMGVWNAKKLAEELQSMRQQRDEAVARHLRTVRINSDLVNQRQDLTIENEDREAVLIRLEDAIDNIDQPGLDAPEWIAKAKGLARKLVASYQEEN